MLSLLTFCSVLFYSVTVEYKLKQGVTCFRPYLWGGDAEFEDPSPQENHCKVYCAALWAL